MALHTRTGVPAAILKPKVASSADDPLENWEDKLAKIIAARRASQEMRKGKPPVLSKTRKIRL